MEETVYEQISNIINNQTLSESDKIEEIFFIVLPEQQKKIFRCLSKENALSCVDIKGKTGIPTKNISSQLKQLFKKCNNIKAFKINTKKFYYREF